MFRIERSALRRTSSSRTISGASRLEAFADVFQRHHLHVLAVVAAARLVVRGRRDKGLVRIAPLHLGEDARFGDDDELIGPAAAAIVEDRSRRPHEIGHLDDIGPAFGMHDDPGCGVLLFEPEQFFERKLLVNMARPVPDHHILAAGQLPDVSAQVAVGREDDGAVGRDRLHDFQGIRRSAADIGQRLDPDGRVDIRNHRMPRVPGLEGRKSRASHDSASEHPARDKV